MSNECIHLWYEKVRELYFKHPDLMSEELEQEALYLFWKDDLKRIRNIQDSSKDQILVVGEKSTE